jgi:RHS repeat-associated protein
MVNYGYDALDRRISRMADSVITPFIYDSWDVVRDIGSDGSYIDYLDGEGIDEKLRQTNVVTGSLYFLQDHLTTTTGLIGSTGSSIERLQYQAFGANGTSTLTRYTYTAREQDRVTGLIYYRARWYDPQQGRFLSEDPMGFRSGDPNAYAYVLNNPISLVDPTGEVIPFIIIGIGVGIIILTSPGTANAPRRGDKTYKDDPYGDVFAGAAAGVAMGVVGGKILRCCTGKILPKACFTAGTKISKMDNKVAIEDIKIGDLVWGYDEYTGEKALHRVVNIFHLSTKLLVILKIGNEIIETTADHPFWVIGKGWIEGGNLQVGDMLMTLKGKSLRIDSINYVRGNFPVYNFEVEGIHTYYVSDLEILVHNKAVPLKPMGSLKKPSASWLKQNGIDPHTAKDILPGPVSRFDIYVDKAGNLWGKAKGAPDSAAEFLGHIDSFKCD